MLSMLDGTGGPDGTACNVGEKLHHWRHRACPYHFLARSPSGCKQDKLWTRKHPCGLRPDATLKRDHLRRLQLNARHGEFI